VEYELVSPHYHLIREVHATQRVIGHAVGSCIVNDEIWPKILKNLRDATSQLSEIAFIIIKMANMNTCTYILISYHIPRVDIWVVSINYVHLRVVSQVSLVPIPLMCIQVYNKELSYTMPLPHIMADESNVRVNAEPTSFIAGCVMIPTRKVDCPPILESEAGSIY
jgi:hypothetical protein